MHYYLYRVQFTYQQHAANQMGSPPRNRRDIWSELGPSFTASAVLSLLSCTFIEQYAQYRVQFEVCLCESNFLKAIQ